MVTSGHAGVFPPGLPVGIVSSVTDGEVHVQPYVDWARLEYVTILRYRAVPMGDIERRNGNGSDPADAAALDGTGPTTGAVP